MNLKMCTCGNQLTTRNVKNHGQMEGALYVTCLQCKSTAVLLSQKVRNEIEIHKMAMEDNERINRKKAG